MTYTYQSSLYVCSFFKWATKKKLETEQMFLLESISVVERCENLLKIVAGRTGKVIPNKFYSVTIRNDDFQNLREISKILSSSIKDSNNLHLDPEHLASLEHASITSADVARSFSEYKNILSEFKAKFKCCK